MVIKKQRIAFLLICISIFAAAFSLPFLRSNNRVASAMAEIVYENGNEIKNTYFQNENFDVPNVKLFSGGAEYVASGSLVVYPDGRTFSKSNHSLNLLGKYEVIYYASVNGKEISASDSFTVVKNSMNLSGGATAETVENLENKNGEDNGGLSVSLPDGSVFTYDRPFNLANRNSDIPVLELYPHNKNSITESYYETDEDGQTVLKRRIKVPAVVQARILKVRLTDCYDSDNFIEINIDWNLTNPGDAALGSRREATCTAGANGQNKTALIANPNGNTNKWYSNRIIDGDPYLFVMSGTYGKGCTYNEDSGISIYYDDNSKRVYIKDKSEQRYLLTDLDDPNLYFTVPYIHNGATYCTGAPFEGFTTGEVYISLTGSEYFENTMQVEIGSICGVKGQDLGTQEVLDETPPTIKTIAPNKKEIYVAKGEETAIFSAKADDLNGIARFDSFVWYGYGTNDKSLVGVKDGKFIPERTGVYTIEYIAADTYGNEITETVDVISVNTEKGTAIDFDIDSSLKVAAGKRRELHYTVYGLNGNVDVLASVSFMGSESASLAVSVKNENEGFIEFVPTEIGLYALSVTVFDGVNRKVFGYVLESVASDAVYFSQPVMPDYFIEGMSYTLDRNTIRYFDGVTESKYPDVYISEDGGERTKIDYENFKINADTQKVAFYYYDGDKEIGRSGEKEVVRVSENGKLSIDKYFVGDFTAEKETNFITFRSNTASGDNDLAFINPLSLNNFYLAFSIDTAAFDSFDVTIADYYDRSNMLVYSFARSGNNTAVTCFDGDGREVKSETIAKNYENSLFILRYDSKTGMTMPDTKEKLGMLTLPVDRVLVGFTVKNQSGSGAVKIRQINNQPITNATFDSYNPTITVYSASGSVEVGNTITIFPVVANDVLSPYLKQNLKMTVTDYNDAIVTAEDGTVLDGTCDVAKTYDIKLKDYGTYTVRYSYKDQTGEVVYKTVLYTVSDNIKPVLELQKGYGENMLVRAKVGSSLPVAQYRASDNKTTSENLKVDILIVNPRNEVALSDGATLKLTLRGEYKVYYLCEDEYGNQAVRYYTIIAE